MDTGKQEEAQASPSSSSAQWGFGAFQRDPSAPGGAHTEMIPPVGGRDPWNSVADGLEQPQQHPWSCQVFACAVTTWESSSGT